MEGLHFEGRMVPRISFGCGNIQKLGTEVKMLNGSTVLLVADAALSGLGLTEKVRNIIESSGLQVIVFDQTEPEPTLETADACTRAGRDGHCDVVVGIGGGSTMDTAKAAGVLLTNEGPASDYQGQNLVKRPGVPTIMIPTTAGTGSEVTGVAVFINRQKQLKLGINTPYVIPALALLDPELTVTLPPSITVSTGMDALTHAVESYISKSATPLSEMFSLKAVECIGKNLKKAVENGRDLGARSHMLFGSCLAGLAILNGGVCAAHAVSYPMSVFHKVPHGVGCGILLPRVVEQNRVHALEKIAKLWETVSDEKLSSPDQAADRFIDFLYDITLSTGLDESLKKFNITGPEIENLAEKTMALTGVIANNPAPFTREDARKLLEKVC
ncbi:MAG: iron-containing alcohol dehydrogenase [Desulfobacterales bacterium]